MSYTMVYIRRKSAPADKRKAIAVSKGAICNVTDGMIQHFQGLTSSRSRISILSPSAISSIN